MIEALKQLMSHPEYSRLYKAEVGSFIVPHDAVQQGVLLERIKEAGGPQFQSIADFFVALQAATKELGGGVMGTDYRGSLWRLSK